jgi:hypothetical protein
MRGSTMNSRRNASLVSLVVVLVVLSKVTAQPGIPKDPKNEPPPPGVDKFYWDLSHSEDRVTKSLAERYINTIRAQEWSDLSGKFKTIARYVRHEPDLSTVTIESGKGRGAERVMKEVTVPVDKLSKTCQSRVRQIDAMQKKLKELAASNPDENGAIGSPMTDERGADPAAANLAVSEVPPGTESQSATPEPDPSASEPDPLGFAELPEPPPAGPDAGPGGIPPEGTVPPGN